MARIIRLRQRFAPRRGQISSHHLVFSARDAPARADPPVLRPHHGNHSDVAPREDLPAVFSCHRAALRRRKMPSEASPPQWAGRAAVSRGCLPRRPPGAGRKLLCLKGKRESPSCGGTAKDQYLRTELRSLRADPSSSRSPKPRPGRGLRCTPLLTVHAAAPAAPRSLVPRRVRIGMTGSTFFGLVNWRFAI